MKKTVFLLILYSLLTICVVYGDFLLDEYAELNSPDIWSFAYDCFVDGDFNGATFNMTQGLSAGDNISLEVRCTDDNVGTISSADKFNVSIFEVTTTGPNTSGPMYASNLFDGSLFNLGADNWCGYNMSMEVLFDMTEGGKYGWYVGFVTGTAGDILRLSIDRAATDWHNPTYGLLYNAGGNACAWTALAEIGFDDDILNYRVNAVPAVGPVDNNPPLLSDPLCTSCDSGTNNTADTTPTINVTAVDIGGGTVANVCIGNVSTWSYDNCSTQGLGADCSSGSGNDWICTASADIQISGTDETYHFVGLDDSGNNHSASNLSITINKNFMFVGNCTDSDDTLLSGCFITGALNATNSTKFNITSDYRGLWNVTVPFGVYTICGYALNDTSLRGDCTPYVEPV